jgi:hypothetical protein
MEKIIGHPFDYTGKCFKIIPIPDMLAHQFGVQILNTDPPLFSEEFLKQNRIAFSGLSFLAIEPEPCKCIITASACDLLAMSVSSSDYKYLGPIAEEKRLKLEKHLAYDENYGYKMPGRYVLNLKLPMKYTPLTLGAPFVANHRLSVCLTQDVCLSTGEILDYGINFIAKNFTHAVVSFKTLNIDAYNWSEYGFMYNGGVNSQAFTTSFIRPLSDADDSDYTDDDYADIFDWWLDDIAV